ncbi:FtsK/SpoIIIE domain-containing protein [Actinophytocola algeriensis]|uniref:S-DNA-T family DNA segregation ATPase FtsK/SpoIIIE n=1 Tax=Actinophytocola algeriensis TaxID=1768010 RepID=A0A7W7Q3F9_9PSEU|nr:FtsK/SpoIIIE domain-containing protein [Actinophytocola algeriensis]MBB4906362.1 S-DNA-T family DNA segregation ATPase FtsK/SpoIIIE [Actinophytocola algeriensis]MBE1477843.1 S-DNA-T family DNA segregation ATPase FtsK/SpoIIIE [Actinophytocola algeriensis]
MGKASRGNAGKQESTRRPGAEWRAALWAVRHPGSLLVPGALGWGCAELGPVTMGVGAGAAAAAAGAWYRGHPDSFDRVVTPRVRSARRRWWTYRGGRWRKAMQDCELFTTHRKTGADHFPRVVKVRAHSPTVDTVWVELARGQSARSFTDRVEELCSALNVERIGIEKVKPRVVGLVVQHAEPFTEVIDAPEMPADSDAVDLSSIYLGDDEFGGDWRESLNGNHWFVAGATGAGKNSIGWSLLRTLAPLIRDGLVRLWVCDPKQMEFAKLAPIAHRYAATDEDCADLIADYVDDLKTAQQDLGGKGKRTLTVSVETPVNLLILDEMGALLAYGDYARDNRRNLAVVGSQGRSSGHHMVGFVQEPTKDTVPVRDLFTVRVCLRLTAAGQVDGVLGEDARLRGALADEIPNVPETAGIGYVVRPRTRVPMRVRAAYVDDREIDQLVNFVRTTTPSGRANLEVVA